MYFQNKMKMLGSGALPEYKHVTSAAGTRVPPTGGERSEGGKYLKLPFNQ